MDLYYPTIVEVPVDSEEVDDCISSNGVHPDLLPYRDKNRDTRGQFKCVGPGMASNKYIFYFNKPASLL